jgi:CheY-like chemotaxis protein
MEKIDTILLAEDNADDVFLMRRALRKAGITAQLHVAQNGEEAIDYLAGNGVYADRTQYPKPSIVILDIKMPKKTGLEVLEWLRKNSHVQVIPTVVMSASEIADDIQASYVLGANTFFMKPSSFDELVKLLTTFETYWSTAKRPAKQLPGQRPP